MNNLGWNIDAWLYDIFLGRVDRKLYRDVLAIIGDVDRLKIDEFGCGTGELTSRLPKKAKVRAVDYSPNALKKVRQKTGKNVKVFCMDFYKEQPKGSPNILIACRSLYHKDINKSMKIVSEHIGKKGTVIIAHPQPSWLKYVFPKWKGLRLPSFVQLVKSYGRFANFTGQAPYALFSSKKWLRAAKKYFKKVELYRVAFDTHYVVKLSR